MINEEITEADLKRGIAAWSNRLHIPVTRMMSRVLREEIQAARAKRILDELQTSKSAMLRQCATLDPE